LAIHERVIDCYCNLSCDLGQKIDLLLGEDLILLKSAQIESSEYPVPARERQATRRLETFGSRPVASRQSTSHFTTAHHYRLPRAECQPGTCILYLNRDVLPNQPLAIGKVMRVGPEMDTVCFGQRHAHQITLHDTPNTDSNGLK
jgi:hypothetical protein